MQLEFKKKELELNVYGEKYTLIYPTAKRMVDFMEDIHKVMKGETETTDFALSIDLFVEAGLPKEVAETLYGNDIKELIRTLDGQKKS